MCLPFKKIYSITLHEELSGIFFVAKSLLLKGE